MNGSSVLRRTVHALCVAGVTLAASHAVVAAEPPKLGTATVNDPIEFYFTDQYSYDDNLFRVPDGLQQADPSVVAVGSLADYVNRASVGVNTRFDWSRQVFKLNLRVDDVRFRDNDQLNYTGGVGSANWDWQVGSALSGRFVGAYDRQLANFSNYRFFDRDVLETFSYGGDFRLGIGSRWGVLAGVLQSESNHSAELRQVEDFESTTGTGGLEYRTPAGNAFGLEYRYTEAKFPNASRFIGATADNYTERVPGVHLFYLFSEITTFDAHFGRLERDYDDSDAGDFEGNVWQATLRWAPRTKLWFEFEAWRQLKAYADAESDYFVAKGGSFGPGWEITQTLKMTLTAALEDQDYIGSGLVLNPIPDVLPPRQDKVKSGQLALDWSPRDFLSLGLIYKRSDRESNREFGDYKDNYGGIQFKVAL
jgi:hypothetical protein